MRKLLLVSALFLTIAIVSAQSQSTLETMAQSMPAGSWAQLMSSNIGVLNQAGTDGNILPYSSNGAWDSTHHKWLYAGNDHIEGNTSQRLKFAIYDEASNSWSSNPNLPPGSWSNPGVTNHGYYHHAMDNATGMMYRRMGYYGFTWQKYSVASDAWTTLPLNNLGENYYACCGGAAYFPDLGGLIYAQGGDTGGGTVYGFDGAAWRKIADNLAGLGGTTFTLGAYNPILNVFVFGQNGVFYKLTSNGIATRLGNPPVNFYDGSGKFANLVADPVSGRFYFLTLSNRQLYSYDLATDQWQAQASTGMPNLANASVISSPIQNYGVIMYAACQATNCRQFLYKPSSGTLPPPDTTAPSAPTNLTASVLSQSQITIGWTASVDNIGVTNYSIFRNGSPIASTANVSYADSGLTASTTYTYAVSASDAAGNVSALSVPVSATTLTVQPPPTPDITTSLSGLWTLDDGSGTTALDRSGNGNNGTLLNGAAWVMGKVGQAVQFDGVDDGIAVPDHPSLNPSTITLAVWVNTSTNAQRQRFIDRDSGGAIPYFLGLDQTTNTVAFRVGTVVMSGHTSVSLNTWHHVVGVYDGTSLKVYLDNVLDNTVTATAGLLVDNGFSLNIGRRPGGVIFTKGILDDVRVYGRALTALDISGLWNNGNGVGSAVNSAPIVNAGPDQSITLPNNSVTLAGTASDDGLPSFALTFQWSGPSGVSFSNNQLLNTNASFASAGTYTLTLTVSDGALMSSDNVVITVSDPAPPPGGSADFQARCSAPGVVKCVGFDTAADITGRWGIDPQGVVTKSGGVLPVIDTAVKASGNGSMRMTVPAGKAGGVMGDFFANFSNDYSSQFGENSNFYVQVRMRLDSGYLQSTASVGMKQVIIGTGSTATRAASGCSDLELVMQNTYAFGIPRYYQNCGRYEHLEEGPFPSAYSSYDYLMQNARPRPPGCWHYARTLAQRVPPTGACFPYLGNEWLTFQWHIQTGPLTNKKGQWWFADSHVDVWAARQGQPSEQLLNFSQYDPSRRFDIGPLPDGTFQKYGQIWLLTYSGAGVFPVASSIWYDELIISTQKIADAQ